MSAFDFLLIIAIAAGAFYAGYQIGRASVLDPRSAEGDLPRPDTASADPLPGPALPRQRGAPPPGWSGEPGGAAPAGDKPAPRRTTKPPPAAAGLLDKGSEGKG